VNCECGERNRLNNYGRPHDRAEVSLSVMENFPFAFYNDRHLLKAEFATTLTCKSMMEIFPFA
jgi:hypothetical protein